MEAQRHKIMRQVLEVRGCPSDAADRVRNEIRGAYYQKLLPLIESACTELSEPGRVHRIETLEIDLGGVPIDTLEFTVTEKFEAQFRGMLASAIDAAPATDADLELLEYFIQTGTVPWWADRSDHALIDAAVRNLIARAPRALLRTLRTARAHEPMMRRITLACSDDVLDAIARLVAPVLSTQQAGSAAEWIELLGATQLSRTHGARLARSVAWEELLTIAGAEEARLSEAPAFFSVIIARVARRLGADYAVLLTQLRDAGESVSPSVRQATRDILTSLARELEAVSPAPADVARDQILRDGSNADAIESAAVLTRDPTRPTESDKDETRPDLAFSDVDEVYVENAGLVILWPFLESFFSRLELLEDKQFTNEASRQRAVGLLQYLAAGDESPPEYLLPLNKVLCGMAPDAVFDFGPEITASEIRECNDLLVAAIQRAPILNDMSVNGFRGSFLLRKGQLSTRDGIWLLRVERESYDIVLDRFPWSLSVVKLPWMEAMMQVEW